MAPLLTLGAVALVVVLSLSEMASGAGAGPMAELRRVAMVGAAAVAAIAALCSGEVTTRTCRLDKAAGTLTVEQTAAWRPWAPRTTTVPLNRVAAVRLTYVRRHGLRLEVVEPGGACLILDRGTTYGTRIVPIARRISGFLDVPMVVEPQGGQHVRTTPLT